MKWFPPLVKGASHMCRSSLCGQEDSSSSRDGHAHTRRHAHTPRSVHSIQKILHYARVAAVLRQNVDVCWVSSDLSTQHQNTSLRSTHSTQHTHSTRTYTHAHTHHTHTHHTHTHTPHTHITHTHTHAHHTQYTSHTHNTRTHLCNFCPLPCDSEHLHPIEAHVVAVAPC